MIQIFGLATVGRDVEVRSMTNGDAVANVSLAFTYGRKGEDGKKPTQWAEGVIFGKRAEALAPYLTKGTRVTVALEDAHIETFKKQDGTDGVKLAARITAIDLAVSPQQAAPQQTQQRQQPQQRPAQQRQQNIPAGGGFDDMADDAPF